MKKIVFAAVLLFGAGLLPSCQKEADVKPASLITEHSTVSIKKDLGTAD